ncbi:MAG: CmcI family methyltransferase [Candidatus Manganitrophus sp.]|nr:MAG: CmcI family methyltransferase [Candidatus Manganitrophus sp.]
MRTKEVILREERVKTNRRWDWLITEAFLDTKPKWVIQIGTQNKYSVLYSASILKKIDRDLSVITVVKDAKNLPQKSNVRYIEGNLLDSSVFDSIKKMIHPRDKVMVILEDGLRQHPIVEIQTYAPLVTEGCYLILGEEVAAFAGKHMEFEPDWTLTKPQVYLRKPFPEHSDF